MANFLLPEKLVAKCFSNDLLLFDQKGKTYIKNGHVVDIPDNHSIKKRSACIVIGAPYIQCLVLSQRKLNIDEYEFLDDFYFGHLDTKNSKKHIYILPINSNNNLHFHVHLSDIGEKLINKNRFKIFIPLPLFIFIRCESRKIWLEQHPDNQIFDIEQKPLEKIITCSFGQQYFEHFSLKQQFEYLNFQNCTQKGFENAVRAYRLSEGNDHTRIINLNKRDELEEFLSFSNFPVLSNKLPIEHIHRKIKTEIELSYPNIRNFVSISLLLIMFLIVAMLYIDNQDKRRRLTEYRKMSSELKTSNIGLGGFNDEFSTNRHELVSLKKRLSNENIKSLELLSKLDTQLQGNYWLKSFSKKGLRYELKLIVHSSGHFYERVTQIIDAMGLKIINSEIINSKLGFNKDFSLIQIEMSD